MEDSMEDFMRINKNAKDREPSIKKISAEILLTIQKKKECEARGLKIVEFLIEGKLQPETFLHCVKYINQEHYQDIVEERAITKLCGYPLCGRKIPDMPKQRYIISTKANKIYEITDRKNYCSNFCYKASLHIKNQIDTSPLWLRNYELYSFNLLPASEAGKPGEVIDQGIAKPVVEPTFTSITDFAEFSLKEAEEMEATNKQLMKNRHQLKKLARNKPLMNTIAENEDEHDEEYYNGRLVKEFSKEYSNEIVNEEISDDEVKQHYTKVKSSAHKRNLSRNMKNSKITKNIEVILEEAEVNTDQDTNDVIHKSNINSNIRCEVKEKRKQDSDEQKLANLRNKLKMNKERQIKLIDPQFLKQSSECELKVIVKTSRQQKQLTEKIKSKINEDSSIPKSKPRNRDVKTETTRSVATTRFVNIPTDSDEVYKKIKQCIREWLTIETYLYIYGEDKIKQILDEKKLIEYFDKLKIGELHTEQQLRYMGICKRLQLQELAEEKFDGFFLGRSLNPLPDYKHLKKESKDLDLKVKSFYSGVLYEKPDLNFPSKPIIENQENGPPAVLPLVDITSQNILRRKVFLNAINKTLQNLIQDLKLGGQLTLSDVQDLVRTFKLEAHNVVFKPAEWNLIAVVLINMSALKNSGIKKHLLTEWCREHIDLILCKFTNVDNFMRVIFSIVEDLDSFIEYHIINNDSV